MGSGRGVLIRNTSKRHAGDGQLEAQRTRTKCLLATLVIATVFLGGAAIGVPS